MYRVLREAVCHPLPWHYLCWTRFLKMSIFFVANLGHGDLEGKNPHNRLEFNLRLT